MSDDIILKASNVSKQYRLGLVGTGTLTHDLNRFWHKIRGKEDPYLQIGAVNDRSANASSDYVWALQDINFEVKRGEILGIIGKNGAGKSTLLKILSRVTSPTMGSIKTKGRIASLLEVGTGMHPELTGRENIYLNGAILGMNKTEISSNIDEIIEFSGCQMYIDTPVKRYSSGMRVRLGFAVAAFLEPDILVVDEVLAVGDAEFQKKAIGKMQDISNTNGRTVLFVSHNMASISDLCTRCIVLENGSVKFDGNTALAIDQYLSINNDSEQNSIYTNPQPNSEGDILKVSVLKNDKPNFNFGFEDEIYVKFDFTITENLKNSFIGIRVVNLKNVNIFSSEKSLIEFKKGTHSLTVKIPSKFLVPNFYYINIGYHVPNVQLINYTEHAVEFHIEETGSDLSQFAGKDFGCVMMDCEWY